MTGASITCGHGARENISTNDVNGPTGTRRSFAPPRRRCFRCLFADVNMSADPGKSLCLLIDELPFNIFKKFQVLVHSNSNSDEIGQ